MENTDTNSIVIDDKENNDSTVVNEKENIYSAVNDIISDSIINKVCDKATLYDLCDRNNSSESYNSTQDDAKIISETNSDFCVNTDSTSNNDDSGSSATLDAITLLNPVDVSYSDDATHVSNSIDDISKYSTKSESFDLHDISDSSNKSEIILCISCHENFEYTQEVDEHYSKGYRLKPELCNDCKERERQQTTRSNSHWSGTQKSGFCFAFQKDKCMRGASCRYRHIIMGDPSPIHFTSLDTRITQRRLCFAFQRGECTRGSSCRYYHSSTTPSICYNFFNTGDCHRGESCRYYHTHSNKS